ncbi:alpha-1,6-mannosylglycoprotein 6-beta-N-acetylglucosaminyltransferase A-like [Xenentodon cancila]
MVGIKMTGSLLKDYRQELQALQVKVEIAKAYAEIKDETIKDLRSDKRQLQQQMSYLGELLKIQLEKEKLQQKEKMPEQVKSEQQTKDDEYCPLPSMDGFPHCQQKLKWMKEMWKTNPCYSSYGVNGSFCSFVIYLSEVESWCPRLPGRAVVSATEKTPELKFDGAVIRENFKGLYESMGNKAEFLWIQRRIKSMEDIWLKAIHSLSAKYKLKERKAKQILVHPGAITRESGVKLIDSAFSGGPLGELVQWSDLIATLYILGHHLHLSTSIPILRDILKVSGGSCPQKTKEEINLIYTDIHGLHQIQPLVGTSWDKYKCMVRVLDTFGTEPDFNHAAWSQKHNLKSPYGGLHLIPLQFYTMFPHTPDNTFLGFVVQHRMNSEENEQLKRKNQALVYGKRGTFWKDKDAYLDVIHKYLDIHGTVDNSRLIPSYVKNHGIVKGTEVHALLRQSKVFVGLSFPYEGPAPLEALANACAFLNPKLDPPQSSLNTEFFKGKPNIREVTSQHPYAEGIGEPYVWTIDINNQTEVERALKAILNQSLESYLPYEFTCEGMLQRVNVLIEKQDFCSSSSSWPPLSALQVVTAEAGTSCKQACMKSGLICEPAFFGYLNNTEKLSNYNIDCQTSEFSESQLVFPAYNSIKKHCLLQSDPLLFSCVRSDPSLIRICPCRDYIKDQVALCKTCI